VSQKPSPESAFGPPGNGGGVKVLKQFFKIKSYIIRYLER
jgi:hypothetical protein